MHARRAREGLCLQQAGITRLRALADDDLPLTTPNVFRGSESVAAGGGRSSNGSARVRACFASSSTSPIWPRV